MAFCVFLPALSADEDPPGPPVLGCLFACPNTTDFAFNQSGNKPGGVSFGVLPGDTTSGTRRKETPCNLNTTCTNCESTFDITWHANGQPYTVSWRRYSGASWSTLGDGTDDTLTIDENCNDDQVVEYSMENAQGQQVFYTSVFLDCGCDV